MIVLKPIVNVVTKTRDETTEALSLSKNIANNIEKIALKLLSSKYKITQSTIHDFDQGALQDLCLKIDADKSKELNNYSTHAVFDALKVELKGKYAALLLMDAKINPAFEPHYQLKTSLATDFYVVNKNIKPQTILRLLVIDLEEEKVVFHQKIVTKNYDPRVNSEVEQITRIILKRLYYK